MFLMLQIQINSERVVPEIETFLGPEMGTSVASAIWAQKSRVGGWGVGGGE